ncbi:hypothetical protein DQG23_19835 [Paenibacillus contaminans]|uniref:Uncharacterized protein n=1 Tax=Paenibacillus contaminans TaxID=450362 RepID=A0A329MIS4_9BACL|nr:hypothetical protein DQG23_19835 [Paenibacillus contaminans]
MSKNLTVVPVIQNTNITWHMTKIFRSVSYYDNDIIYFAAGRKRMQRHFADGAAPNLTRQPKKRDMKDTRYGRWA